MRMNVEGIAGSEAGGRALERYSWVEKDFDTGKREEETGRNGECQFVIFCAFIVIFVFLSWLLWPH